MASSSIKQLDKETKIVGCPVVENPLFYTDFPTKYATLFDTKIFKSLKINMMPKDIMKGQDVGWEMREKIMKSKYTGKNLVSKNTRYYKKGPFRSVVCTECYLNNKLMASHFGRGALGGGGKYFKKLKIPIIKKVLREFKGRQAKLKWIKICNEIIEKESSK